MAGDGKEKRRGYLVAMGASLLLAAGLAVLVLFFQRGVGQAMAELDAAKEQYNDMVGFARRIEEFKKKGPPPPPSDKTEDIISFLGTKSRQAGIPPNLLNITRNPDQKSGGWKEISFTMRLKAPAKENPVRRDWVADFIRLVEDERPSIKSKNLSLAFAGNDLLEATVTLATFQREESRESPR